MDLGADVGVFGRRKILRLQGIKGEELLIATLCICTHILCITWLYDSLCKSEWMYSILFYFFCLKVLFIFETLFLLICYS